MPDEFTRYHICQKMGWDYYTYMSQPSFFIEEVVDCMTAEKTARDLKQQA